MSGGIRIAIDRGGTFTDVVAQAEDSEDIILKLLSVDPANYEDAPTEGIRRVLETYTGKNIAKGEKLDLDLVESIRMGTTVATNALLERKGEKVAFLVTKGFKDILLIGQQARPDLFDLSVTKLGVLYESVHEIDERITIEGYSENPVKGTDSDISSDPDLVEGTSGEVLRIIKRPDVEAIRKVLQHIWDSGVRSLAIALLHSYVFPQHENLIAEEAHKIGFTDISVSSKLQPMIKIVSRSNSATADAYLSPITTRYIENIGKGFKGGLEAVGHKLLFMQSDGGLTSWSDFSGLRAILSGPAGGVVGYAKTTYENSPVLGFDMGGTSTDVSRYDGTLDHIFETTTAQVTIQSPQLDINTVAAGGGSILFWKKGLFAVGPESASAHPGPACYRKGGPLTVTDANVFLGRIIPDYFPKIFGPNENEPLDREIVEKKFAELTKKINSDRTGEDSSVQPLSSEQVAMGFLEVANEAMCRPIRTLTEGKGLVASRHILASFGGAGGQHANAIAANLGISRVVIHRYSSLLSAYGIALADVVHEVSRPESVELTDEALPRLSHRLDAISEEAIEKLADQGFKRENIRVERYLNLKYRGTETFIMVLDESDTDEKFSYSESFVTQHRQEFGFSLERPVLVGDIRVRGVAQSSKASEELLPLQALEKLAGGEQSKPASSATTKVYFDGLGWANAKVYHITALTPGQKVSGPGIIIDQTQTIVVAPQAVATALPTHIVIDIDDSASRKQLNPNEVDPIQLSVFGHRFMSIAEQMGQTLQKTAISTNIKERLDFSCAIFSSDGGLVANAPHIPVHLGSMSSAVSYQKTMWEGKIQNGDVLVANHPAYGGSHLPDITVITPVFDQDGRTIIFWVASRGHHSDIGGITAGSMPPFSKHLWEEGATIKGFKIVNKFKFDEEGIVDLLYHQPAKFPGCSGSRSLSDSISDVKAQIAANNKGINLIKKLIDDFGLDVVNLYMEGIQVNAENSVRELFRGVVEQFGNHLEAEDYMDDGTPIKLRIDINSESGDAVFDFEGTGPQIYGNLNAPKSITHSAILYALRSMISDDIPLNQGCLTPLKIEIPPSTLLSPGPDAATVGGNVETSQRITDVVLRAFRAMGASQGTCNNLTFGYGGETLEDGTKRPGFGYYETIAGGAGAGPTWQGQSGVQVHMTNTRSTDPEILEKRYPCVLHEFSIRGGSGGNGKYRGGDGVIRDIEFLVPMQVSILSERRVVEPYGMNGGQPGQRGVNLWYKCIKTDSADRAYSIISLSGKNTVKMDINDRVVIKTPGGGGYGES